MKFYNGILNKILILIFVLPIALAASGCGKSSGTGAAQTNKSQLQALLEDFTSLDNTKDRMEKRNQQQILPAHKLITEFYQLDEKTKALRVEEYLRQIEILKLKLTPVEDAFKYEGQQVEWAHRYVDSVKSLLAFYKHKNEGNLPSLQRDVFDGWLGYRHFYNLGAKGKGLYRLDKGSLSQLKIGQSYRQMAKVLQMPAVHLPAYLAAEGSGEQKLEAALWVAGSKYILVKFQAGKAVSINHSGIK